MGVPGPGLGPIILWTEPGEGSGPGLGPKMGPGDRPAPGEGPGWDIPPDVSEGVDIYRTAGRAPDSFRKQREGQDKFSTTIKKYVP